MKDRITWKVHRQPHTLSHPPAPSSQSLLNSIVPSSRPHRSHTGSGRGTSERSALCLAVHLSPRKNEQHEGGTREEQEQSHQLSVFSLFVKCLHVTYSNIQPFSPSVGLQSVCVRTNDLSGGLADATEGQFEWRGEKHTLCWRYLEPAGSISVRLLFLQSEPKTPT